MKKLQRGLLCCLLLFSAVQAADDTKGVVANAFVGLKSDVPRDKHLSDDEQKFGGDDDWQADFEVYVQQQQALRARESSVARSADLVEAFAQAAAEFKRRPHRSNSLDEALAQLEPVISDWRSLQDPFTAAHNLFFGSHYDQAIADYWRLIQAGGGTAEQVRKAHIGLGESLLAVGSLIDGFLQREHRLAGQGYNLDRLWNGHDCLNGKTLLIRPEGGFGDIAFFQLRYVPWIQRFFPGCTIVLEGDNQQQSLYKQLKNVRIVKTGDCREYHYDLYGMSLPRYFNIHGPVPTDVQSMPKGPYIRGESMLVAQWVAVLNPYIQKGLMPIGIFWEASTNPGGVFRMYDRNIDQDLLINSLKQCKDVALFNLQGPGSEAVVARHQDALVTFVDFDKTAGAFQDTVAFMEALRLVGGLVVGIDTGALNFAGAVGVKTLALLPECADWRWGVDQEFSVWFPTMRLIRQHRQGDWSAVMAEVQHRINTRTMFDDDTFF